MQTQDLSKIPCTSLKGVGPAIQRLLKKCGITVIQDLLFHLPFRYQDRTRVVAIRDVRRGDHAVIEGTIELCEVVNHPRAHFKVLLSDATGSVWLRFFHFTSGQVNYLKPGLQLRCYGEVRSWKRDYEMIHPEYRRVDAHALNPVEECLTPIYPTTEGLSQYVLRSLTEQALELLSEENEAVEYLPTTILKEFKLPSLIEALRYVHRPPPSASQVLLEEGVHPAQQRLAFEELLAHHLSLRKFHNTLKKDPAPVFLAHTLLPEKLLQQVSFALTNAQQRVLSEINADMQTSQPMLRLVQGDVGSGKTIVAALCMLQAIESGYQAVLMAPTELLVEQHFQNFTRWMTPLGIDVIALSGKLKTKARNENLKKISENTANIVIGTHALFQKEVEFSKLGLVVIDEQHRFGVHQRLSLREKGNSNAGVPHQLIMTATPIPRTLAMTIYADLDVSIIDELPPSRTPVVTVAVPQHRRLEIIERIRLACQEGRQVYWVCTLIEESDVLECQAAEVTAAMLREALPEMTVGLVHGQIKSEEKEMIMAAFKEGKIHVLVATTVIEVGVDVPNATLMIIENPERLGLAQLHQLRGRVGRGTTESHCVLLYQSPLSELAKERLSVMRATHDGFEIARKDLELRGPGEILGTRQAGAIQFRVANIFRDQALIPNVQAVAKLLFADYPESIEALLKRWIPQGERYREV